jgi:hypothetical protein
MKHQLYGLGWTDPRAFFDTSYKEPEFYAPPKKEWGLVAAYIGLGISGSMAVAPMVWVKLFQWIAS